MLRLEKFARAPENTALKGPELKNLCNNRVKPMRFTYFWRGDHGHVV